MKNNILVDQRWTVYPSVVHTVVKLDADNVVRSYQKCASIPEGLLG